MFGECHINPWIKCSYIAVTFFLFIISSFISIFCVNTTRREFQTVWYSYSFMKHVCIVVMHIPQCNVFHNFWCVRLLWCDAFSSYQQGICAWILCWSYCFDKSVLGFFYFILTSWNYWTLKLEVNGLFFFPHQNTPMQHDLLWQKLNSYQFDFPDLARVRANWM